MKVLTQQKVRCRPGVQKNRQHEMRKQVVARIIFEIKWLVSILNKLHEQLNFSRIFLAIA